MLIKVRGQWMNPSNIIYLIDQGYPIRTKIRFLNDLILDVPGTANEIAEEINRQIKLAEGK